MSARPRVAVVGSGLAGLVAATSAQEAGTDVIVFEAGDQPGGASRDSAGWIWRYRDRTTARACAPHGDAAVQEALVDRLDDDLEWLAACGVTLRTRDTGRALTVGGRIEPVQAIAALVDRLDARDADALQLRRSVDGARLLDDGGIELRVIRRGPSGAREAAVSDRERFDAVVFAGGGYATNLQRIAGEAGVADGAVHDWVLRSHRGGDGSSLDAALELGALRVPATGECLVRLVPSAEAAAGDDEVRDSRALVRAGELQVPGSTVHAAIDAPALEQAAHDWSGAQVAWELARTCGRGTLHLDRAALRTRIHAGGTVEDAVRAALDGGAAAGRLAEGGIWLAVRAGITGTRCGLRVDGDGRLLRPRTRRFGRTAPPEPIPGAFAAGIDAADPGMGGIASGLALALVLGRRAGELAAAPIERL